MKSFFVGFETLERKHLLVGEDGCKPFKSNTYLESTYAFYLFICSSSFPIMAYDPKWVTHI